MRLKPGQRGFSDLHDVTLTARKELGIAEEQAMERFDPVWKDNLIVDSIGPKQVLSDLLWRTLTLVETAMNILVLCEFMHAEYLGKVFEREGHQVTVDSLCNYTWYSRPPERRKGLADNIFQRPKKAGDA
jgi:hypothetical protein